MTKNAKVSPNGKRGKRLAFAFHSHVAILHRFRKPTPLSACQ